MSFTIVKFFYILFTTVKAFYQREIPSVTTAIENLDALPKIDLSKDLQTSTHCSWPKSCMSVVISNLFNNLFIQSPTL